MEGKKNKYRFTLFTPCYNSAPFIDRMKASVEKQTFRNFEWIVVNDNSYAGNRNHTIGGIKAKISDNSIIRIRSHIKNGKWLSEVTKCDNTSNGYSGIKGKAIDGIAIKSDNHKIEYRVHLLKENRWLDWVSDYNINDLKTGMAGNLGSEIDEIQIKIV